jgi:hypothetical protein
MACVAPNLRVGRNGKRPFDRSAAGGGFHVLEEKMRTADERLRTWALAGNRELETVPAVDLADQLADGHATLAGDEPDLAQIGRFDGDGVRRPLTPIARQ